MREDHRNPSVALADRTLPIAIRRHARATRLTMRIAPDGSELRITLPRWGRTRDALVFARARTDWIEAQLARLPQRIEIAPGVTLPFRGTHLLIDWREKEPRRPQLAEASLVLGGPQDTLQPRIRRWMEAEALRHLADDLAFYCGRGGHRDLPQLRLSRAQRRWGSCSGQKDDGRCIRINWRLIMAPDHVRRSVVAHEVAHLTHFDHSPSFHALLGDLYDGDLAHADRWLKHEGRSLYAAFG
nr:YgjP-like metallopeptidase domain-containing protein [Alteraurantiacibacter aestuarii]